MAEMRTNAATGAIDQNSLVTSSSSPSVLSTITTISAVVAAASTNNGTNARETLANMDEIISKSLLLIDFAVALVAIFFNIFVLYAVKKANSQSMLEGYRGFLLSLAFSDLLIATTTLFTPIAEFLPNTRVSAFVDRCGRTIVRSFTIAAYMSALLNLAGMSVDHYIGVFYSLRYHQIMTTRLVCITVALSWLLSIIFGFFDLFGTVAHFSVQTTGGPQPPPPLGSRFVETISNESSFENEAVTVAGMKGFAPDRKLFPIRQTIITTTEAAITTPPPSAAPTTGNGTAVKVDKQFNKLLIDILFGPIGASDNNNQTLSWEDLNNLDDSMLMMPQSQPLTSLSSTVLPPWSSQSQPRRPNKNSLMSSSVIGKKLSSATSLSPMSPASKKLAESFVPASLFGGSPGGLDDMEGLLSAYGNSGGETNFTTDTVAPEKINSTGDTMFDTSLLSLQQDFNIDLEGNRFMDWCSYYTLNKQLMEFAVVFLTVLVFTGLLMIYGRIFREVSSKRDEKGLSHRTGKLVVTTVILLGAFFFCWIPFITFEAVMVLLIRTDTIRLLKAETHQQLMIVNKILNTTLILHPLLDPLIYAVRVRVVRTRLKKVYDRLMNCRQRLRSVHSSRSSSAVFMDSRPYVSRRSSCTPFVTQNKDSPASPNRANCYHYRREKTYSESKPLLEKQRICAYIQKSEFALKNARHYNSCNTNSLTNVSYHDSANEMHSGNNNTSAINKVQPMGAGNNKPSLRRVSSPNVNSASDQTPNHDNCNGKLNSNGEVPSWNHVNKDIMTNLMEFRPLCPAEARMNGGTKQMIRSNEQLDAASYYYPGVLPKSKKEKSVRRTVSAKEPSVFRNVVISLTSPLLLTRRGRMRNEQALARLSSLPGQQSSSTPPGKPVTVPLAKVNSIQSSGIPSPVPELHLLEETIVTANNNKESSIPSLSPSNNSNNNNNNNNNANQDEKSGGNKSSNNDSSCVLTHDASLIWSSGDDLDANDFYSNDGYFGGLCSDGMVDTAGDDCCSSSSVSQSILCSNSDAEHERANKSHRQPVPSKCHHCKTDRQHHKRTRRNPSRSATFILNKVESHTRMLFAALNAGICSDGKPASGETKKENVISDGLEESAV